MENNQAANEKKIFDAIQELKDCIFGLKQTYTDFCYEHTVKDGCSSYMMSTEKLNDFANELSETAKAVRYYNESFDPILPVFFKVTIMFLTAACNPSDWLFVSIRKIGGTVFKTDPDEKSTFDIMVETATPTINDYFTDGLFWKDYELFNASLGGVDLSDFEQCVKRTIERFIDEHELNALGDDVATQNFVARINRTAVTIARDLRRSSR